LLGICWKSHKFGISKIKISQSIVKEEMEALS